MGGRGSSAGVDAKQAVTLSAAEREALPYQVTGFSDELGGAVYPFLERINRAWHVLTWPLEGAGEPHPAHTFGLEQPTLRWVNGDQVVDVYVDGMTTEAFLAASGLALDLSKGGFVLSKRMSRIMRPYFVSNFFGAGEVKIAYLEQTPAEAKVWDGAGLISRRMLRKLALGEAEGRPLSGNLSPAKRERLEREIRHAQRVEFTIMTAQGQDKGHAIVADDLRNEAGERVDFLLPQDTKREVRLEAAANAPGAGHTFVGLNVVHGHNDMRLDIQSLINLHPFFAEEQLLSWLHDEGQLFLQAVESGRAGLAMARIDRHATLAEIQSWPLREYLASGGDIRWSGSHVKTLINQHLKRLNHATLGNDAAKPGRFRLPIPGGRHYVMPAAVGRRAGIPELDVPRGQIRIDPERGTAWVNDEDWLALPDSPKRAGVAGILGGADNDDALWLHPFTDHDGEQKVLAWRSPNQVGEYVVLKPTPDSHTLPWTAVGQETLLYPAADSRKLPPRLDFTNPNYLNLVDPASGGGPGRAGPYSIAAMDAAIDQAIANQGALGLYCNSLMVNKALYGRLPDNPPAPLEDIIDSAVKTGADLSRVVEWNYQNSRQILEKREPIPGMLHRRLSVKWADKENRPPAPRWSGASHGNPDHWLDRLENGVKEHIRLVQTRRDELAAQARPPQALFDQVPAEDVRLGAGLNQAFAGALAARRRRAPASAATEAGSSLGRLEQARQTAVDYLSHFHPDRWHGILRGALVSAAENGRSDAAAWLAGEEGSSMPGLGNLAVAALREIRLLDDLVPTREGVIVYPSELYDPSP
jgi:hypothetical protein